MDCKKLCKQAGTNEGVSYLNVFPVGETSRSRCLLGRITLRVSIPVARGPSDAIRASERVSPAISIVKKWRFRSFRTYMSIATCAGPMSRSIRTLIRKHVDLVKPIKDLKDLSVLRGCAGYRH